MDFRQETLLKGRLERDAILSVDDLSLSYGKKLVFNGVNFVVKKGLVTGIIGPSGCGKSSFISCLNRMIELVDGAKVEGRISFNQKDVFDQKIDLVELRKEIGIVFQEPTPLPMSIIKNIELPLREHKFDRVSERAVSALKSVGLWDEVKDQLNQSAFQLSGGQKQRLCLARTIALEPKIILMDEPCSSLDPLSTKKIEELILRLKEKFTILIVTHNLAQARRVCDYVYAFWYDQDCRSGVILEEGSCSEIFDHTKNQALKEYVSGVSG